jgi:Zn-dependent protease
MVVLPLLFVVTTGWPFGYASAPYDREWAMRYPRRAAWMALAGPAANFLLVVIAILLVRVGVSTGLIYSPHTVRFGEIAGTDAGGLWPGTVHLLGILFSLNLLLGAFNLLPLPPLDGSAALTLLLSPKATRSYQEFIWGTPAIGLFGILIAWKLFDVLFDPIFTASLALLYPGANYH